MRETLLQSGNKSRTLGSLIVHILLLVYAAILVYIVLGLILNFSVSADIFFGLSFALLFFALGQSIYELGVKNAISFLAITSAIGFLAEVLGTNSGIPFGKYYYTDFLGEKFLGVPVVVPLVWFVISYLSYSIVAGNSRKFNGGSNKASLIAKIALLSAFGAVSWDFMIDPMFSSYGYWVWTGQFLPLPETRRYPTDKFSWLVRARWLDDFRLPNPAFPEEWRKVDQKKQRSRFGDSLCPPNGRWGRREFLVT